ncbi:HET-domain-containing protein [Pleomassaria siparia CBS 279.74]|uniref:HET-domain-containing protein n=1 Tax=Pleomassaria siparia CBS 279.74 TaxID=1314801 RepID=A0A6G1K061_9PLEO|nr:HET-domain-containing protein [Pleomassaria siparia CBS 279.74]
MDDPYAKARLDPRNHDIRLVKLALGQASDPISLSFHCHSVLRCPPFVALSYTWGGIDGTVEILLDGIPFEVSKNLWTFLDQTRERLRSAPEDGTFWIDAICIHQSSPLERNHQVQMMHEIYSNARSVAVWLGPADPDSESDLAMDYIQAEKSMDIPQSRHRLELVSTSRQGRAFLTLCEKSYWRRVWVQQEILHAKELNLYYGSKCVSWSRFEGTFQRLELLATENPLWNTDWSALVQTSLASVIVKAKLAWDGTPKPLKELLETYCDLDSSLIADKVYGLLGLASDRYSIEVDYRLTPTTLFYRVLDYICTTTSSNTGSWSKTRLDTFVFGKMLRQMLNVRVPDSDLERHILLALNSTVDTESISNASHMYRAVTVLLIKWGVELDVIETRESFQKLQSVFRDEFRFETTILEFDSSANAQDGLDDAILTCIDKCNKQNSLLIVYYSGSAIWDNNAQLLELHPIHDTKPLHIDWSKTERILHQKLLRGSDVLVILNTNLPSHPVYWGKRDSAHGRVFQYLSICHNDALNHRLSRRFLTEALSTSLSHVLVQHFLNPFTTVQLQQAIQNIPEFRHTSIHLWWQDPGYERHIRLSPLGTSRFVAHDAPQGFHPHPRAQLSLRLNLSSFPTSWQLDLLRAKVVNIFHKHSLVQQVEFLGAERNVNGDLSNRAALIVYTLSKWKTAVIRKREEHHLAERAVTSRYS